MAWVGRGASGPYAHALSLETNPISAGFNTARSDEQIMQEGYIAFDPIQYVAVLDTKSLIIAFSVSVCL